MRSVPARLVPLVMGLSLWIAGASGRAEEQAPQMPAPLPSPAASPVAATDQLSPDQLPIDGPWVLRSLDLSGVSLWRSWQTRGTLTTRTRPWWKPWGDPAPFDAGTFSTDLERVRRELVADGDYQGDVRGELRVLTPPRELPDGEKEPGEVAATIVIEPGEPVLVCHLEIGPPQVLQRMFEQSPRRSPWPGWLRAYLPSAATNASGRSVRDDARPPPLAVGVRFTEAGYQAMEETLIRLAGGRGYPHPRVERSARVDVPSGCVDVRYEIAPGRRARFAETSVVGLQTVAESVVRHEIAWREGRLYDEAQIEETRRRLRNLRLFSVVQIEPEPIVDAPDEVDALGTPADPTGQSSAALSGSSTSGSSTSAAASRAQWTEDVGRVPMRIRLREGPPRELRIGVGYSTEERVRGQISWRDWNFLGGARQLGFALRLSEVTRWAVADFVQPHFPGPRQRSALVFNLGQDSESTYLLDYARIVPRIDFDLGSGFLGRLMQRSEYDSLSGVSDATRADVPDYRSSGFTISMGGGLEWARLDDLLDPRRGVSFGFAADVASEGMGSDFNFFRTTYDMRAFAPLAFGLTLANRLRFGTIVPFGNTDQIQLWERFYAGGSGINPVRGYGRRRIGPLSGSNDPLGGRSMLLGSVELRYPLFGPIEGYGFVDVGAIEPSAWQIHTQDLQFGVGPGLRALTPLGPVSFDIGFGLDRHGGDALVQVSFSIGPSI